MRLGGRPTRTQFEFTLQDANLAELNEWAPKILAKMKTLPELRDVATDQQTKGTTLELKINRDTASRYGITPQLIDDTLYDAFGQRQVDAIFHPAQHLPRDPGDPARAAGQPRHARQDLCQVADSPATRCRCRPLRPGPAMPVRPLSISHQGQFPAITISFNLAPGRRARTGDRRRAKGDGRTRRAGDAQLQLPGHRAGVPAIARHRAAADPRGAGRGLSDPRHPLRELHPPDHDPVDAALGRRRRARDPDGVRLRLQPDRADRHHPVDRHRQEERHHDGRLRDRGRTRPAYDARSNRSGRRRCCASVRS